MNFQALLPIAKVLFPNNSKLIDAAEKAVEICKGYNGTEDEIQKVIKDLNISPGLINRAVVVLNSPAFQNKIDLFQPGLGKQMQDTVSKMMGNSTSVQIGHSESSVDSNLSSLRDRLSKL